MAQPQPQNDSPQAPMELGPAKTPASPWLEYHAWFLAALFPLSAGFAFYGWRVLGVVAILVLCTLAAASVWRRIGRRGAALHPPQLLWMALMLAMMLPAHLCSQQLRGFISPSAMAWAVLAGAAILLVLLNWVIGPGRLAHIQPAVLTYLALALLFGSLLSPHVVLRRAKAFNGDVLNYLNSDDNPVSASGDDGWVYSGDSPGAEAIFVARSAGERLSDYTSGRQAASVGWYSLEALLREAMPPLEDLLIGGHPGPIGGSSAIAVLIGGLFLMHRRIIDYRTPLLVISSAYLALLLLPVPVVITDGKAQWLPMVVHRTHLDWATIITFVNYEVAASPLLLTAFFLATSRCICPAAPKACALYATMIGFASAALMLYFSCTTGPYIALAVVGLFAPGLDRRCDSRQSLEE